MSLAVTDAPVDEAAKVVVEFTGVEVKPASGSSLNFDFAAPRQIDLLALNSGVSTSLLDQVTLPAGKYNFLRLKVNAQNDGVNDSFIELDGGATHELTIPTADTVGLKIGNHFTIAAGGASNFTIDFDLRKSVHKPEGQNADYVLRPTLRLVDNLQVGSISGTVAPALIGDASCVTPADASDDAVYVYAGAGIIPDDVDGIAPEPVTSAMVTLDTGTGNYVYKAAFLVAGEYTVAFTCQAANDDPVVDNTIAFVGAANVTVTANTETVKNF
ncbi:MAG: DUF4382 domain-containing protein [Gammaproteobacteria bacterium]